MNIQQILKVSTQKLKQNNIPSADLDAEVLLLEALNKLNKNIDKSWLYANNKYILNKKEEKLFNSFINQRKKHKPVAYIINRKEFYGYEFYVDENVLIPRPETELIVEEVLKILNNKIQRKFILIDIGTGSGCIIISILNELKRKRTANIIQNAYANDISLKAIKIAKHNANKYNLNKKIKFVAQDLEKFISKKTFCNFNNFIITANLPYIKNDEYKKLLPNVRRYEPRIALTAGKNGLVYIEKLIDSISKIQLRLNQKIYLLLEANPDQMSKITTISKEKLANVNIKIIKDLNGNKRLILLCC
ncbi:MAG: peptide chain release factor N(5)-glutamine methyltransferase [Candidatus Andersenbacteria bacterium]|nr:peptide chain release factor N(5)-glutamine methyltransferase [Candidatus Andersenbacteria bacterium]